MPTTLASQLRHFVFLLLLVFVLTDKPTDWKELINKMMETAEEHDGACPLLVVTQSVRSMIPAVIELTDDEIHVFFN